MTKIKKEEGCYRVGIRKNAMLDYEFLMIIARYCKNSMLLLFCQQIQGDMELICQEILLELTADLFGLPDENEDGTASCCACAKMR